MESLKPTYEELEFCMRDLNCIRNVCILAHVDHGKTTVADSLLATNRLVSKRLAGFLRYLDDRPDEQERGITMKSSAVSLLNLIHDEDENRNRRILLNLIDTPGHIDFSTEVGAALRVSDGAIILVDLVEGVCPQTRESIKNAFEEHTKMILILNKFDRLIAELQRDADEIFQIILRVIEGCNAIIAELYQYEFPDSDVDVEDTGLLFSPDSGNVIFASALNGWGFTTKQIARLFVNLVQNETVDSLNAKLWNFDCYINSKKEIKTGAIDKKKTNLFIQFCIKPVSNIYETLVVRMEKEKTNLILQRLNIINVTRDMSHNDPKVQVRAILQAWKPLATTILLQCLKLIPSPREIDKNKIEYLLNVNQFCEDPYLAKCINDMIPYFQTVSNEATVPTIAYISKMFCVSHKNLSQNKPKVFVPRARGIVAKEKEERSEEKTEQNGNIDEVVIVALARVFSGTLHVGQEMYVMSGQYLPNENQELNKHATKVTIKELYMLFGRELMLVDHIPAGNFCGIGGLDAHVVRTATLSSVLSVVPILERSNVEPVVRHAVEPVNPKDLPVLRDGLRLLMQSDSCVEVMMQETGELTLLTAGDVHLGKCIEDLKNKFAKVELHVSKPMVSLRETILNPSLDYDFNKDSSRVIKLELPEFTMSIIAVSLPKTVVNLLIANQSLLRIVEEHQYKSFIDIAKHVVETKENSRIEKTFKSDVTKRNLKHFKEQLMNACKNLGSCWKGLEEKIWSVGKIKNCVNLLVNNTANYIRNIYLEISYNDKRALFDHCIVNAFNKLCRAGPLCEETLTNCCFIINSFDLLKELNPQDITPQVASTIESAICNAFKKSLSKQEQRLMEPMYTTDIQVNTNILGKVYSVVNKRHGRVLEDVCMDDKEKIFLVRAQIPVIESEGFANEIRKATSGQANPTLRFSHYEIIDGDPFYEQVDEDEEDEEVVNVESGLRANRLRKEVRRRKGLQVEDEVVVHAEKQRTKKK